ncbi:hypothetical protein ElyMa_001649000 [Elysia marginata]|uniref:Uncharacterized protein n=1 Tax=Elysia marginata TaxID=1093978 RepID=A0AAV4JLX7_9GAST|nr:hypothetical protein ElyMa_001649000 [Elysia marginata]
MTPCRKAYWDFIAEPLDPNKTDKTMQMLREQNGWFCSPLDLIEAESCTEAVHHGCSNVLHDNVLSPTLDHHTDAGLGRTPNCALCIRH